MWAKESLIRSFFWSGYESSDELFHFTGVVIPPPPAETIFDSFISRSSSSGENCDLVNSGFYHADIVSLIPGALPITSGSASGSVVNVGPVAASAAPSTMFCTGLTSRDRNTPEIALQASPNPCTDHFTLHLHAAHFTQPADISLYNINGQQIYWLDKTLKKEISIDMTTFPAGIYFCRVTSASGSSVIKVSHL
jgi:hypothetical protein